MKELSLDLYIKDKNNNYYRNSDNRVIDSIHHKLYKTDYKNIEKAVIDKYNIYKNILKEGSVINIVVSEDTKFSSQIICNYDGKNIKFY